MAPTSTGKFHDLSATGLSPLILPARHPNRREGKVEDLQVRWETGFGGGAGKSGIFRTPRATVITGRFDSTNSKLKTGSLSAMFRDKRW
jgi:hypothetical protein